MEEDQSLVSLLKGIPLTGILSAMATIVMAHLTAVGIEKIIDISGDRESSMLLDHVVYTGVCFVLFFISTVVLYKHRDSLGAIRVINQERCSPHRFLILPLSPPNKPVGESFPWAFCDKHGTSVLIGCEEAADLESDIKKLNELDEFDRWNWQQVMRAVNRHKSELKTVVLIGSKDNKNMRGETRKGSWHFRDDAERLIGHYLVDVEIRKVEEKIDFQDFKAMSSCLKKQIDWLKKQGYSDDDIIIDVTGGQVTTSIAGAAVTMRSQGLTFQYVTTNPGSDDKENVLAYNVRVVSPASSEM